MKVVVLAGSLRAGSFNKKLAALAAEALRDEKGIEVALLALEDFKLPPYNGDEEEATGMPEGAEALKKQLASAQGLVLVSPEYNGGIPGSFKNAIDWASRGDSEGFAGQWTVLLSASPGGLGGMRSLAHLRDVCTTLELKLLPTQMALPKAHEAFDEDGKFKEARPAKQLAKLMDEFVGTLRRWEG